MTPLDRHTVSLVPPQHGAWAFLGLPLLAGLAFATWSPVLVVLAIAWIAAYPLSYFVLAFAKDAASRHPHPERLRRPLTIWAAVAVPVLVLLVALRPWLIWPGLLYALAFAVNLWFARRRDDRALVNDAVFIAECSLLVPITWAVGAGGRTWAPPAFTAAPPQLWIMTAAVALLLTGSTLHVKSLIRERGNPTFGRLSLGYALACVAASVVLAFWWGLPGGLFLIAPFAWAAGRSIAMRGTAPAPSRIGVIELVAFLLLAVPALALAPA